MLRHVSCVPVPRFDGADPRSVSILNGSLCGDGKHFLLWCCGPVELQPQRSRMFHTGRVSRCVPDQARTRGDLTHHASRPVWTRCVVRDRLLGPVLHLRPRTLRPCVARNDSAPKGSFCNHVVTLQNGPAEFAFNAAEVHWPNTGEDLHDRVHAACSGTVHCPSDVVFPLSCTAMQCLLTFAISPVQDATNVHDAPCATSTDAVFVNTQRVAFSTTGTMTLPL